MSLAPVTPDPAASVIVLRSSGDGLEVLMVRRNPRGFFGGLVVFPGGGLDDADRSPVARAVADTEEEDHPYRVAALRELAEETGLLATRDGVDVAPPKRGSEFYESLLAQGLNLATADLVLVSRWVTPEMAPRRFDTFFYLLPVESTPPIRLDTDELVDHTWVAPDLALRRYDTGEWPMFTPTFTHLHWLTRRSSVGEAVESAQGADGRTVVEPVRLDDGSLLPILLPSEPR